MISSCSSCQGSKRALDLAQETIENLQAKLAQKTQTETRKSKKKRISNGKSLIGRALLPRKRHPLTATSNQRIEVKNSALERPHSYGERVLAQSTACTGCGELIDKGDKAFDCSVCHSMLHSDCLGQEASNCSGQNPSKVRGLMLNRKNIETQFIAITNDSAAVAIICTANPPLAACEPRFQG